MKRNILLILLWASSALFADINVKWGYAYIKNNSKWDIQVSGKYNQAFATAKKNIANKFVDRTWFLAKKGGFTRLGRLDLIKDITFRAVVPDEAKVAEWLRVPYPLRLQRKEQVRDLLIDIGINRFTGKWITSQRYITSDKIAWGGKSGYHLEKEIP